MNDTALYALLSETRALLARRRPGPELTDALDRLHRVVGEGLKRREQRRRPTSNIPPESDVLVIFSCVPAPRTTPNPRRRGWDRTIWDPAGPRRATSLSADRPAEVDFAARRDDILRMARQRPEWALAMRAGIDPDDLDGEIMMRLIVKQQAGAKSRYDPTKSGVTKYLCVTLRSVILNTIDLSRYRRHDHDDIMDTNVAAPQADDPELIESIVSTYEDEDMADVRSLLSGMADPDKLRRQKPALVAEVYADLRRRAR